MKKMIYLEDAINAVDYACEELRGVFGRCEEKLLALPSAQPEPPQVARDIATIIENEQDMRVILKNAPTEQRPLTEDDYAYCTECDHVEMCRWYPMYGCEFKSRPSAQPERQVELDGTESNIEILSELRAQFNCFDEAEEPCYRALTDAICALSTQPEPTMGQLNENGQSTKDCISRQGAIRLITGYKGVVDKSVAKRLIAQLPSAQPEHNYCRECKWSRCHINADKYGNTETYWRCIYWCGETDEEGFCYNWERRTDDGE